MTSSRANPAHPVAVLDMDILRALDARLCPAQAEDEALIARVRARLFAPGQKTIVPQHLTVHDSPDNWEQLAPGFERKVLWEVGDAVSCLYRLAPGTVVQGHAHPIDEELVVLEGSLRLGEHLLLARGDFHLGRKGLPHAAGSTETGAVIFVRGAKSDAEPVR